ncbi:MAG: hypothetical protein EXS10_04115 [Phycisphaerales bacterium]|nr:hypothetical protein [Phycisphaerales bacterium]
MTASALHASAVAICMNAAVFAQSETTDHARARAEFSALTTKDGLHYQTPSGKLPWDLMDGLDRARAGAGFFSPARFITLFEPHPTPVTLDPFAPHSGAYGFTPTDPLLPGPFEDAIRPLRNLEQYLYEGLSTSTNIYYTLLLQGLSRTIDDPSGSAYQRWSGTGRLDVNLQTVFAKPAGLGTSTLQVLFRDGVVFAESGSYSAATAAGTFFNPNSLNMSDHASLNILAMQQGFLDDRLVLTVGKMPPNSYFLLNYFADDESAQFLNGSLDGNDVFQPGQGNYCPGLVVQGIPCDDLYVNAGIFDIADNSTTALENIDERLYFAALEVGWTPGDSLYVTRYSATIAVSNQGRDWESTGEKQTNVMFGLLAQKRFDNDLAPFVEYAIGSEVNATASMELSIGLGVFSPLGRTDDYAGIGWSWAQPTSSYGDLAPTNDPPSTSVLEAFYRVQLTNSMQLSPDIQLLCNPANGDDSTVVAFALRLKTQF